MSGASKWFERWLKGCKLLFLLLFVSLVIYLCACAYVWVMGALADVAVLNVLGLILGIAFIVSLPAFFYIVSRAVGITLEEWEKEERDEREH